MNVSDYTTQKMAIASWVWINPPAANPEATSGSHPLQPKKRFALLQPLRNSLDAWEVSDRQTAHAICKLIPAQCPFERDVKLFGKVLFHIPPMCKINPLYEELVGLRFRALCYLADTCGEDISQYC